jgi:cobalt-zinc-cadmium efflux system membrane fusion protein
MNPRLLIGLLAGLLLSCGSPEENAHDGQDSHEVAEEFERGPHRGRLLRDGDFAVEITIFETGVPPEFRLYAYRDGKPLPAQSWSANVELHRLDGELNSFAFRPEGEFLRGDGTVEEPHSFDVVVRAAQGERRHEWKYPSYEGRTTIATAIAEQAGVAVEPAGKAIIRDNVHLLGGIALNADRHAAIKARFDGTVRDVRVRQGDRVRRGQTMLVVEGNESMRNYDIPAPFDGVVLTRETNVGDVTSGNTLLEIADLSQVWVELHALGDVASRIKVGQKVAVKSATGELRADAAIRAVLPVATRGQSVIVRAVLANPEGSWRPGMTVEADVTVSEREVPLAVRESGLQRFRDFTVVFAQVGETYEVRMLELGARDGTFAEVLGGLKPGTLYVTEQSFLIKADIEKSGASHDH